MEVVSGNGSDSNDARLARIVVWADGHDPVQLAARPRNYHAPINVCHDIDSVRVTVDSRNPRAGITINGIELVSEQESSVLPLSVGKNVFSGAVTSASGVASEEFSFKIFRGQPQPAWEMVREEAPWVPRDSAGELVFRDRMWLLGGYIPSMANDVWSSDDGVAWTRGTDVPTESGIDIPVAFVFNDRMWVTDIDGVLFSSADGESWSVATDNAPWRGRGKAGCVVFNGKIWVMGGVSGNELLNDVWSSTDGVQWTLELKNAPWSKRQIHHTPLVLDNKMWLLGGGALGPDYHPFVAWNDVWSSVDGVQWEQVTDHAPWPARIWGSSAVYRDRLWMIGGFRSEPTWENLGDVWYSSDGVDWRQLDVVPTLSHSGGNNESFVVPGAIWAPRHEQSVYVHDDSLWVVGGMVWPLMNDVWRLTIDGLCFVTQPVIEIYTLALYEYHAHADLGDSSQVIRYRLNTGPEWLSVDVKTGVVSGAAEQRGDFDVSLEASDASGSIAVQNYTLHVLS